MSSTGRKCRVLVLMGGSSSERAVSLSSGQMILEALDPSRYDAGGADMDALFYLASQHLVSLSETGVSLPGLEWLEKQRQRLLPASAVVRPDVVFIALHGRNGEDGRVQGLLDLLGIPYTGSGVLASALAMNKHLSKQLFRADGLPTVPDIAVVRGKMPSLTSLLEDITAQWGGLPVFVKPNEEGSSVGCTLVERPEQLETAIETAHCYDALALIEPYVSGTEITVGVLEHPETGDVEALPVVEIVPRSTFYDYDSKYTMGGSEHIIPARLPAEVLSKAQQVATRCHMLLGCRGMSRTDLIVANQEPLILEVNTIPGMTPTSLLPDAAASAGISFAELVERLIRCALRHTIPPKQEVTTAYDS
ncbi:D-alanine--D-alanine ligase family protein [Chthonomonas calidirosea]|uniref:D-alanine--D-alanine ligase family protein n=1 Tax=Chthonomonas calidirosea TaxID=454171 RepID=UPI000948BC3B|nr:D-alanine--D-alanine ligase [Chthonomonas calidirosea]